MTHPVRSILVLAALAVVLAACGTTVGAPASPATPATPASPDASPSQPATPSVQPSVQPSVNPSVKPSVQPSAPVQEERQVAGTITVYPGAFSGPGGTIAEAIANGPDDEIPSLVNGVLFRDTDGTVYLATSIGDAAVPTFDGPMLEVLNTPNDGPSWDMAYAELNNLEEANGILFRRDAQVLGIIALP